MIRPRIIDIGARGATKKAQGVVLDVRNLIGAFSTPPKQVTLSPSQYKILTDECAAGPLDELRYGQTVIRRQA